MNLKNSLQKFINILLLKNKDIMNKCSFCYKNASQVYPDSGFYRLNDLVYCSLNCFNDENKKVPKPKKQKTLGKAIIKSLKKVIKHKGKKKLETKKRKVS